ncbi:MAG: polyphenol oxidase family protein [Candidatus Sumerlaeia bacterium]|nr:polyphenol oxidase family protein [Candidatus Sumerlaeia bacterium]
MKTFAPWESRSLIVEKSPPFVAESTILNGRCVVFSTNCDFDDSTSTPWHVGGERLLDLFTSSLPWDRPKRLVFANQVHGATIGVVDHSDQEVVGNHLVRVMKCDGLVSTRPGDWLVIRTADCLPIALVDVEAGILGCLHAGWRGSFDDIMTRGIESMVSHGAIPGRIHVFIGPCISGEAYEVSEELADRFLERFPDLKGFVTGRKLDLGQLNRRLSEKSGVPGHQITQSPLCTWQEEGLLHSHRRQGTNRGHQYLVCGLHSPHEPHAQIPPPGRA